MTTTPDEQQPLPVPDPVTGDAIAAWLKLPVDDEQTSAAAAVSLFVRGLPIADTVRGQETWPPHIVLGATMLAVRIYRRRNNPEGVMTFGDDGVVYVRRNDPDVALLLQLGDAAKPQVG